jgi:hypothetical protein
MPNDGGLFAQQEAQRALGAEVARYMSGDAVATVVKVSALVPTSLFLLYEETADGDLTSVPMDMDFDTAVFANLRGVMYQPGSGTWFSAEFRVDRTGAVDAQFNYDSEPEWDAPVDSIAYVTDFEKYPRDVENQPEWLRAKLAEGHERRAARP